MTRTREELLDEGWQDVKDGTFIDHMGSVFARGLGELGILTQPCHQNLSGIVHGGVLMTAFDRVMGMLPRNLRPGEQFPTTTMTIEFLRPVKVGEFIHLTASITKAGPRALFVRGMARVGDRDIGAASAVFMAVT
ncbi:PaaI family thioesterase [Paracoccus sp. SY]|uniref:PaaI family thioesterase n=1 Tax=Paracoccus sp. SY TaxID=1330255 RepID=UPI000CD1EF07|nr:PaaI family thioesterase [Paracoccus sp. SY]